MPRPEPTRLREARGAPAPAAQKVIDANFKVVGAPRRTRLGGFLRWTLAFVLAAAIGFLIPPGWVVIQEVFAMLRGQ